MKNVWIEGDYYTNILGNQEKFQAVLDQYVADRDEESTDKLIGVLEKLLDSILDNYHSPLQRNGDCYSTCIYECLWMAPKCSYSPIKFFTALIMKTLHCFIIPDAILSAEDYNWTATINDALIDTNQVWIEPFTIPIKPYDLPDKLIANADSFNTLVVVDSSPQYTPFMKWISRYNSPTASDIKLTCHDKLGKLRMSLSLIDAYHIGITTIDQEYFSSSTLGIDLTIKYRKAIYDDEELLARYGQGREKTQT